MGYGPDFSFGVQRLIGAVQRYTGATTPVYMRFRNYATLPQTQAAMLGLPVTPDPLMVTPGTSDVLVDPPPSMNTLSLHDIGISGGKLRFGAKSFLIQAGWVSAQAQTFGFTDPKLVFNQAVGVVNENMLYSIEDIQHEAVTGCIVSWILVCNANELR